MPQAIWNLRKQCFTISFEGVWRLKLKPWSTWSSNEKVCTCACACMWCVCCVWRYQAGLASTINLVSFFYSLGWILSLTHLIPNLFNILHRERVFRVAVTEGFPEVMDCVNLPSQQSFCYAKEDSLDWTMCGPGRRPLWGGSLVFGQHKDWSFSVWVRLTLASGSRSRLSVMAFLSQIPYFS